MDPPSLTLYSQNLLSKWGFNDGDMPETLMDYWDDIDVPYPDNWHDVLAMLVRRYLLPVLTEHHDLEVYEIGTIHNPIRASRIDGVEIDDTDNTEFELTPVSVTVPYEVIAEICNL